MISEKKHTPLSSCSAWFFLFIEAVLIILYGVFVEWGPSTDFKNHVAEDSSTTETLKILYPIFQDVNVMMFIGFGFLMTYLRNHSWNSVGVNFLVTIFSIQLYFLCSGLWKRVLGDVSWGEKIHILAPNMIQADFAAAAILISFGGVLGKISAFQMLLLTVIEIFFYALNEEILYYSVALSDIGGSISIHTFGAYFGLTVSMFITKREVKDHPNNASNYNSNLFAMIGTLFLWMFWPSFNSALETGNGQLRTQITTIFSLIGSTFATFMVSALYRKGKFHMEDILNATLAGGVMIGASSNLVQYPFAAFIVGVVAGVISTFGFETLSGILQRKIKLFDTAGIHNLHGMPGFLGGIVSAIFAGAMTESKIGEPVENLFQGRTASQQAGIQIAGTFISLGIGIGGGIITGLLLKIKWLNPPRDYFSDFEFWEMDLEAPQTPTLKTTNDHHLPGSIQLTDKGVTDRIIYAQTDENLINGNKELKAIKSEKSEKSD